MERKITAQEPAIRINTARKQGKDRAIKDETATRSQRTWRGSNRIARGREPSRCFRGRGAMRLLKTHEVNGRLQTPQPMQKTQTFLLVTQTAGIKSEKRESHHEEKKEPKTTTWQTEQRWLINEKPNGGAQEGQNQQSEWSGGGNRLSFPEQAQWKEQAQ